MQDFIDLLNKHGLLKITCPGAVMNERTGRAEFSKTEGTSQPAEISADRFSQGINVTCKSNEFPGDCVKCSGYTGTLCPYETINRLSIEETKHYLGVCGNQISSLRKVGEVCVAI